MEIIPGLFGKLCREYFDSGIESELKLELDNGILMDDFPVSFYVNSTEIRPLEKEFLGYAKGETLDIGCGTGRVGVALRKSGIETIGLDVSKDMVYIATKRNLLACLMDVNKTLPSVAVDSVVMYGNGFGMPGTIENIRSLLLRLHLITLPSAIIIAESNDPNKMSNEIDSEYQKRNIAIGRYVGQRKWRNISGDIADDWCDWVQVEPKLLEMLAQETGWKVTREPEYEKDSQWGAYFFTLSKQL